MLMVITLVLGNEEGWVYSAARGGTFEKSVPSPSAIVGCARTASRSLE